MRKWKFDARHAAFKLLGEEPDNRTWAELKPEIAKRDLTEEHKRATNRLRTLGTAAEVIAADIKVVTLDTTDAPPAPAERSEGEKPAPQPAAPPGQNGSKPSRKRKAKVETPAPTQDALREAIKARKAAMQEAA